MAGGVREVENEREEEEEIEQWGEGEIGDIIRNNA